MWRGSFPIIRFDAAMTLAKKHYQRLWFPQPRHGGGIPSRAEHGMTREEFDTVFPEEFWREVVDRVAAEAPDTLLLAEAFWLMEGYFVRTLGMHRVYNSAFMNMLKMEENAKYRQTIKNVLEFNPEVLQALRQLHEQPGRTDRGGAVRQGGQVFRRLRAAGHHAGTADVRSWPDRGLPREIRHGIQARPTGTSRRTSTWSGSTSSGSSRCMRRRWLFSGSENFVLYDFYAGSGVNEDVFAYSNRVGDQRGLVLYHNRYATTAGWIRESAAYAVKTDGDGAELRRTTLAEALELVNDEQVYYAFRDHTLGLVFLRNSRELATQGLYAELGEYEFHVFTDFREIADDVDGTWGRLCMSLNGRGVESLEEELKQLKYAALNAAFRAVLELATSAVSSARNDNKRLVAAVQAFISALAAETGTRAGKKDAALEGVPAGRHLLAALTSLKPSARAAATLLTSLTDRLGTPSGRMILVAWQLLKGRNIQLSLFGLDYSLKQVCRLETASDGQHAGLLLQALLDLEAARSASEDGAPVEQAFATAACCTFMQVHESGGTEWFNKECFEELLEWLSIITLTEGATTNPAPRTLSTRLGRMASENRRMSEAATDRRLSHQAAAAPAGTGSPAVRRQGTIRRNKRYNKEEARCTKQRSKESAKSTGPQSTPLNRRYSRNCSAAILDSIRPCVPTAARSAAMCVRPLR